MIAEALRQRGIEDHVAALAARAGWALFHHASQAWIDDPSRRMADCVTEAFAELRSLTEPVPG